jgi:Domain of unknown function (DUF5666)
MATNSESAGLYPHNPRSGLNQHRRAKRTMLARTALAAAAMLGTSVASVAVASAATPSKSSLAGVAHRAWAPPAAAGTVESVGSNTFTVKERSGTVVTVDVTPGTTTYMDRGVTSPGFGNISTGEMVSVQGTTASGVVTATSVSIGFGGGMFGHGAPPAAAGTVESVGSNTFTVKERSGTVVTVDVTPGTTTYTDRGLTSPGFGSISTGEMVSVQGTTASGVVTATSVSIGFGGGMRHGHGHRGSHK